MQPAFFTSRAPSTLWATSLLRRKREAGSTLVELAIVRDRCIRCRILWRLPALLSLGRSIRGRDRLAVWRCSSRLGVMQTADPREIGCGHRRPLLCGPPPRCRLLKGTGSRLEAGRDGRRIARGFDHSVHRLFVGSLGRWGLGETATNDNPKRRTLQKLEKIK